MATYTLDADHCDAINGACYCGRVAYVISRSDETQLAHAPIHIFLDPARLHDGTPTSAIPAYLRIPLFRYNPTTHPKAPSESHNSIYRYFVASDENSVRHFCGYCGTPLSVWDYGDFIEVSAGTIGIEGIRGLVGWGLEGDTEWLEGVLGRVNTERGGDKIEVIEIDIETEALVGSPRAGDSGGPVDLGKRKRVAGADEERKEKR